MLNDTREVAERGLVSKVVVVADGGLSSERLIPDSGEVVRPEPVEGGPSLAGHPVAPSRLLLAVEAGENPELVAGVATQPVGEQCVDVVVSVAGAVREIRGVPGIEENDAVHGADLRRLTRGQNVHGAESTQAPVGPDVMQ